MSTPAFNAFSGVVVPQHVTEKRAADARVSTASKLKEDKDVRAAKVLAKFEEESTKRSRILELERLISTLTHTIETAKGKKLKLVPAYKRDLDELKAELDHIQPAKPCPCAGPPTCSGSMKAFQLMTAKARGAKGGMRQKLLKPSAPPADAVAAKNLLPVPSAPHADAEPDNNVTAPRN